MRGHVAGMLSVALGLVLGTTAFAQVKGEVESIGFGTKGYYRPHCWTPMVVRLTATTGDPFQGQIVVKQKDMDEDRVSYTRTFPLAGNRDGASAQTQRFWMYFQPQPTLEAALAENRKLSDASKSGDAGLGAVIQVFVCDSSGKQIAQLPLPGLTLTDLDKADPLSTRMGDRGNKLVLCVCNQSEPHTRLSEYGMALGLTEDVTVVNVPISRVSQMLPESLLGYDAVDAVVWFDANPIGKLSEKQRSTLEEFVRRGGQFVICQTGKPTEWQAISGALDNLMPVTVSDVIQTRKFDALKRIHREAIERDFYLSADRDRKQQLLDRDLRYWDSLQGSFYLAIAQPKPGAIVDTWTWLEDGKPAPYIVRSRFGLGTVTWAAQDVADPFFAPREMEPRKWMYVWDRIFDWSNTPVSEYAANENDKKTFGLEYSGWAPGRIKFDHTFVRSLELPGTGTALVGLAVLFFIVYWVVAGPGAYFFLRARQRAAMNWFVFAAMAFAATGLTVGIVKLVLRGAAKAQHVSFVRIAPGEPAAVWSQFGLYIPRDGQQTIEVKGLTNDAGAYVGPYAIYPNYLSENSGFTVRQEYEVPVMRRAGANENDAAQQTTRGVNIPFRSTLKKLQTYWSGNLSASIAGNAQIAPGRVSTETITLSGKLTNQTGVNLRHVYFVFNRPSTVSPDQTTLERLGRNPDWVLYRSDWDANETIDLAAFCKKAIEPTLDDRDRANEDPASVGKDGAWGLLSHSARRRGFWDGYLYRPLRDNNVPVDRWEDSDRMPEAFFLLSMFGRLPAMTTMTETSMRYELGRPSLRQLDVSAAVSAGQLVVLAEAPDTPLPMSVEVGGSSLSSSGTTYYQFILPLDRSIYKAPAARATTQPATAPAQVEGPATRPAGANGG